MQNQGRKHFFIRKWSMATLAVLVAIATVFLPREAYAAPAPQEYTYAECSRADLAAVEAEMTRLAHSVLVEGSNGLDVTAMVNSTWRTVGADATFDAAVDAGVARIQAERGYWERFWSGWSADKAEEFAGQVATYAFQDAALNAKLDELSTAIAVSLVAELEAAAAQSASSALLCLQSYVGEQYSATLFTAFQNTVSKELDADLDLSQSSALEISPLAMHGKGLAGIGVIVATQITRRIAQSLAQKITGRLAGKIAGRVLGRLGSSVIPYVGWAVGIGLLAWDLWEGSNGALPTIRDALTAEDVKVEVRAEIALAVEESVAAEVETLASSMSVALVGQWQTFCTDHGVVCQMAAENSTFRALLDNLPVTDLTRLVQLTDFFWAEYGIELGQTQLTAALADGTFAKLLAAPPEADAILGWTGSIATTLAWLELAGDQVGNVVNLQLYETIDPHRMTTLSLATLLAIDDNSIIHKLRVLPIEQLLTLLQLPSAELVQVSSVATPAELSWLADYLATLSPTAAATVVQEIASGKVTITTLQAPPIAVTTGDAATVGNSGDGQDEEVASGPLAALPKEVVSLWTPWASNGVAVAAGVVLLLVVAVGVALALRRELTNPPV